jgi:hypothetical protein
MLPFARFVSVLGFCSLASCGGGSSGGVGSTPTPTPTPSPTYSSFANLSANQQIALTGTYANRSDVFTAQSSTIGATHTSSKPFSSANLAISYDAASKTYTLTDGSFASHAFGPDQRNPNYQTNGPSFADYSVGDGRTFTEVLSCTVPKALART